MVWNMWWFHSRSVWTQWCKQFLYFLDAACVHGTNWNRIKILALSLCFRHANISSKVIATLFDASFYKTYSELNDIVLKFLKVHKSQWPRKGLNFEPLGCANSYPTRWTWENLRVLINLEHDPIQVLTLGQSWSILNSYFMCAFLGGWFFLSSHILNHKSL